MITTEYRADLIEHVDREAEYHGMSRAAYLRMLVVRDVERQGPTPAPAKV
jgi:hypothetical protein